MSKSTRELAQRSTGAFSSISRVWALVPQGPWWSWRVSGRWLAPSRSGCSRRVLSEPRQELAVEASARSEGRHELRLLALARAVCGRDEETLRLGTRSASASHAGTPATASRIGRPSRSSCPPRCAAARRSAAKRAQRSGRESQAGEATEKACAKRVRAGIVRSAQVWQVRRPRLRLSGVRVVGEADVGEVSGEVTRRDRRTAPGPDG